MNENDYWDCPYCEQPVPPEHDTECHCGMRVSHHLSVPVLCKQLRETQQMKSALKVENKRLRDQRDRLAEERDELKSKYRTHHDEAERITNEIRRVSSVCRELREQRDKLAEALRELCETLLADKPKDITELLNKAGEALAAVKGGKDE